MNSEIPKFASRARSDPYFIIQPFQINDAITKTKTSVSADLIRTCLWLVAVIESIHGVQQHTCVIFLMITGVNSAKFSKMFSICVIQNCVIELCHNFLSISILWHASPIIWILRFLNCLLLFKNTFHVFEVLSVKKWTRRSPTFCSRCDLLKSLIDGTKYRSKTISIHVAMFSCE